MIALVNLPVLRESLAVVFLASLAAVLLAIVAKGRIGYDIALTLCLAIALVVLLLWS